MLKIADISSNNKDNYRQAIDETDAVFIKITEGITYVNEYANAQYDYAISKGKPVGLYHFIVANVSPIAQANYFFDNAKNYLLDPKTNIMLDWEKPEGYAPLTGDEPKPFLDRMKELTGKSSFLYIGHDDFISDKYDWSDVTGDYPIWIAGYPLNDGSDYTPELQDWADKNYFSNPKYKNASVAMWQYTSVPYDKSMFYGDIAQWYAYTNLTQPKPQDEPKFKKEQKIRLRPQATHSAYGTKIDDGTKPQFGVIDYSFPMVKSNSKFAYRVAMHYPNAIVFWHFLEQDLISD